MWSYADSCSCLAPRPRRSPALPRAYLAGSVIIAMAKRHLINMSISFPMQPPSQPSLARKQWTTPWWILAILFFIDVNRKGELRGRARTVMSCVSSPLQVWQLRGVPAREAEEGGVPPGLREAGVRKGRAEGEATAKSNSESTGTNALYVPLSSFSVLVRLSCRRW